MERHVVMSVVVLICINTMDSIMNSVVGPTLIFYVEELGGNKDQYGLMLSIVSLSMMMMIPVYGRWVDSNGNKYTLPYMMSFFLAIVSNVIYFLAILLPKGPIAVYTLAFARLLDGASIAGRALSYSWVASAVPRENQRTIFTLLSGSRTLGMIIGPLSTFLVSNIDTEFQIFGVTVPMNTNNSIGLIMIGSEILLCTITLLFLSDPPTKDTIASEKKSDTTNIKTEAKGIWYAVSHFDIILPIFSMFVVGSCFYCMLSAFSPVAKNLGWDPVQISTTIAYGSSLMALSMVISTFVSMKGISDILMVSFGFSGFFIGGLCIYLLWTEDANHFQISLPYYIILFAYPYIGPANRSLYTKAIHEKKELVGCQGVLMGLVNQAFALSGLITPVLITTFVLRKPEDIETSTNKHQLTVATLYIPILCSLVFTGLVYQYFSAELSTVAKDDIDTISESTTLMSNGKKKIPRASMIEISDTFSRASEVSRRMSVEIMGITNPVDTKYEKELSDQLAKDKKVWEEICESDNERTV